MDWLLYSWPTLILLGLGLRMALRLTYGARGPEPDDPIYVFLNTNSWVLIGLGLAPAVLGGLITIVGGLFGLLAASTFVEAMIQRRAAQRRSMCTMLALLAERGQQLDSSVLLAGQEMRGIAGRAAAKLLRALGKGTPLLEAIAAYPRALPPEAIAYVAAGQTNPSQAAALRELSRTEQSELASVWRACVDRISYLAFVLMTMAVVLSFIMMKIVPEFEKIFQEFDLELPPISMAAVRFSMVYGDFLGIPIIVGMSIVLLGAVTVGLCYLWDMPVLRPWGDLLFRGRPAAHVLRILAVATEQRQSLAQALQNMARVYPSMPVRTQLGRASAAVNSGLDWREALRKSRLITHAEQALLTSAERAGNLPWALRQIALRREKRAVYRLATALQILYPGAILFLGAFVAFFVVALFVPLVNLIKGLTP
jgi:type II secretory pathway component PulF